MKKPKKKSGFVRAKNLLRPFFQVQKRLPVWKEIQSLRQEVSFADLPAVCALAESNKVYPFPGIGNTFPADPNAIPETLFRRLRALELPREATIQIARLNHHKAAVAASLQSLAQINSLLLSDDLDGADDAITSHKSLHGLSYVVIRKELTLGLLRHGLSGLQRRYNALTAGLERTAWALLCRFAYDMIDPALDQVRSARSWLRAIHQRPDDCDWYTRLIEQEVLTTANDSSALASALLRYSALSLTDLVLLIWRNKQVHVTTPGFVTAINGLAPEISALLEDHFAKRQNRIPGWYHRLKTKAAGDIEIYRTSYLFNEIQAIATWRSQLTRLAFADDPATFPKGPPHPPPAPIDSAVEWLVGSPQDIDRIAASLLGWETAIIDPNAEPSNQSFLSGLLAAESLRRLNLNVPVNAAAWSSLLAKTEDIHFFISSQRLTTLARSTVASDNPILQFLLQELIYRKNRTADNELERRLSFMNIFAGRTRDDIVPFLQTLYENDPQTALILGQTCTRAFLERLYLLMASVKDVIETRLAICKWLESLPGSSHEPLKEEHDALTRELANLDARSDLDSTRVHVDEESLREWFNATQPANVSRYSQTVLAEGPSAGYGSLLEFYSTRHTTSEDDDFSHETQIGSEFLLVPIVSATLETFAKDRMFGLDAYLSRRIRHGTLSGQIMTPVNRVLDRWAESNTLNGRVHNTEPSSAVTGLIAEWSKFMNLQLDSVRKEIIQVRSDTHPNGLIRATWKTATNIQHLDAMIARVRQRVSETKGAYDLFPDIYAFCWDCLESDLAQLRLFMARNFLPAATGKLNELFDALSRDDKNFSLLILIELNQTIEARILDVCRWFIRPVFRRDKYDLSTLIYSNLSIVRELDSKYAFIEKVAMDKEVTLNRGSFDVIGDTLFVLIGNAARHGRADGTIEISATLQSPDDAVVSIDVTSECSSLESFNVALERIVSALRVRNEPVLSRAAVEEGFSGLRKLVGILKRIPSPKVSLAVIDDPRNLTIGFTVNVPAEIAFGRERVQ